MPVRQSTAPWGKTQRKEVQPRKHDALCISTAPWSKHGRFCWCKCPQCWDAGKRRCVCSACQCYRAAPQRRAA